MIVEFALETGISASCREPGGGDLGRRRRAGKPPSRQPAAQSHAGGEAAEVAQALKESWPDHPEWVDMLVGNPRGRADEHATYGWFRTAVAQTRFDWAATRKRYDRDGDGRIARAEFPGNDADFSRLDRDHDKALDRGRFRLLGKCPRRARPARCSSCALTPTATARSRVKSWTRSSRRPIVSGAGLPVALRLCKRRFASAAAARRRLPPVRVVHRRPRSSAASSARRSVRSSPGPRLDDSAPDFTLKTNDGKAEITLSKLLGPKPVVLVFGSFTCGPFRSQSGNIEKLYRRYKDRATFVMVYVRDAHPTDGWRMESNDRLGAVTAQPNNLRRASGRRPEVRPAARPWLPDARRHDRRLRRRPLQRHAGPPLRDRPPGQDRVQERPRAIPVQTRRDGAFARPAPAGRRCDPCFQNPGLPSREFVFW